MYLLVAELTQLKIQFLIRLTKKLLEGGGVSNI